MSTRLLTPQIRFAEDVNENLGLTYRQIAAALGADESTLHRWRAGESEPRQVYVRRLEALKELQDELLDAMRPAGARAWLNVAVPALNGRRPLDLLMEGNIEQVTRVVMRLNLGMGI
jgi:transcriptional regulator with XRE-family HTH domain